MNILMVAPIFPPDKSVACVRMNSLYMYLKSIGHIVIVLTNKKEMAPDYLDNMFFVDNKSNNDGNKFKIFRKCEERYVDAFTQVVSINKPDIVIVSGGPFYTFRIAEKADELGIPCILDFRDPWIFDVRGVSDLLSPLRIATRLVQSRYERIAIKYATAVVTVTPNWIDTFRKLYPKYSNKFHLITNGYDDVSLAGVDTQEKVRKDCTSCALTIGVFGKLFYYTKKYSEVFLKALIDDSDTKVLQVGEREEYTDAYLDIFHISKGTIEDTGFIEYIDGIKLLQQKADAFLIVDVRKHALGTKIYDYIYLNKPIIYVGPQNTEMARLVGSFTNGYVCDTAPKVRACISNIKKMDQKQLASSVSHEQYARSFQNKVWMELFTSIVNENRNQGQKE